MTTLTYSPITLPNNTGLQAMFTFSQIKTKARAIVAAEPQPMRYALDEAYHELFAEHEQAEREIELAEEARLDEKYSRSPARGYA